MVESELLILFVVDQGADTSAPEPVLRICLTREKGRSDRMQPDGAPILG